MNKIRKVVIEKLHAEVWSFNYNVSVHTSIDGGKSYWYCGIGKYATDKADALKRAEQLKEEYGADEIIDNTEE